MAAGKRMAWRATSSGGTDLVLGLNIRGDGRQDVMRYIEATGVAPNAFVFMSPPNQGAQSIGGAEDACAMAQTVRERLGEILKVRQLRMTRLFFYVLLRAFRSISFPWSATNIDRAGSIVRISGPGLYSELSVANLKVRHPTPSDELLTRFGIGRRRDS
jgi:hypothetical protein